MSTPVRSIRIVGTCDDRLLVVGETDEGAFEVVRTLGDEWASLDGKLRVARVRPDHGVVGHTFRGVGGLCVCIAYDKPIGYWMRFPDGSQRNVSERAIGRTYHRNDSGEAP